MSNNMRNFGLAAIMALTASAMLPSQASALSLSECSVLYRTAKADGTDAGLKWNDFRKAKCSADAVAAPAAPVTKVAAPAAKPAAPAAAPAAVASPGMTMKQCSLAWKELKASNSVPAGMKWQEFLAAKCVVAAAPAAPAGKMAAPAAPAAKVAAPAGKVATPATGDVMLDKKGNPMSAGRAAMVKRERACGVEWKELKAANKVPVGLTWPQHWSACNKRLKAQGQ